MQYDPKYDYIEVLEGEIPSIVKYEEMEQITREMADELLDKAQELGYRACGKRWPSDFDGAHHVNKEQERLDNFNKNNPTNNLQDLI